LGVTAQFLSSIPAARALYGGGVELETIGTMRTCFPEKFGIPRQPGLAPLARGILRFSASQPAAVWRDAMRGLEGFSHLWVTFVFHEAVAEGWRGLVRPPRLGGKEKMGVWATRSPHRPNFLGLSLLEIDAIDFDEPSIRFRGVDLLDGTPVVDLRPYHPGHDLPKSATRDGWIAGAPEPAAAVEWGEGALRRIPELALRRPAGMPAYTAEELRGLVESLVALDPRPAHQRGESGEWAMRLLGFDVKLRMDGARATIVALE
jgi:tRNA-Thr(GGU) m(6)t(6)A37 methyltransferase TsaA